MCPSLAPILALARVSHYILLFFPPLWLGRVLVPSRRGPPSGPSLVCRGFRAFFPLVSLLVHFSWCPFSSAPISLLLFSVCRLLSASEGFPCSFYTSLSCRLAFPSTLGLFLFLFLRLSLSSSGFSQLLLFPLLFLLFSFHPVAVHLSVLFNLMFYFHYWGETRVSSLASSLRSSASVLHRLFGRCAWRRHLSPLVRCVLAIPSLARSLIGCSMSLWWWFGLLTPI